MTGTESTLIVHRDENDDIMFDIYQDVDSYQSRCMDRSNELMTFSIGGPRFLKTMFCLKILLCGQEEIKLGIRIKEMFFETVDMCMVLLYLDVIMNFPPILL